MIIILKSRLNVLYVSLVSSKKYIYIFFNKTEIALNYSNNITVIQ